MMKKYSKEFLCHLFKEMLTIRICEDYFVEPILKGEIVCPVHLCSGQEASAVGVCSALKQTDNIFGGHRSHGHYLAKGGSLDELVAEIYGKETGCARGRGGSMHLIDPEIGMLGSAPIVAGTISLAVGSALASKIRNKKDITVCFFGDGATNEGVLYESMNFAKLQELPIIFVCENNLYSTHMPIHRCRPNDDIHKISEPFEIQSFTVDGNDVLAVYETAQKAVKMCRNGKGPVFLECKTYRLKGHVGPDDNIQGIHTDIRPENEVNEWKNKGPLVKFKKFLRDTGQFDLIDISEIEKNVKLNVESAFNFAKSSKYPDPEEVERYVYR